MDILKELQDYYHQEYNETQVKVLTRQLEPIPGPLLRECVDEWLDTEDSWLPRGSHLLKLVRKISGVTNLAYLPDSPIEPVWVMLQRLKDQAYQEGIVDREAWEDLYDYAVRLDFKFSAESIQHAYNSVLLQGLDEESQETNKLGTEPGDDKGEGLTKK